MAGSSSNNKKSTITKPLIDVKKVLSICSKGMILNLQPDNETFPELISIIIWMRFIIACTYGTLLGTRNVRGSLMILNSINLITFIPYMYSRFYLNAKMETYNFDILFSGLFPAIALSILIWIYYFTAHYENEMAILAKFILFNGTNATTPNNAMFDRLYVVDEIQPLSSTVGIEEQEF